MGTARRTVGRSGRTQRPEGQDEILEQVNTNRRKEEKRTGADIIEADVAFSGKVLFWGLVLGGFREESKTFGLRFSFRLASGLNNFRFGVIDGNL